MRQEYYFDFYKIWHFWHTNVFRRVTHSCRFYITKITLLFYQCCRNKPKTFAFDHCFYSLEPGTENFASQEVVFDALGRDILDNAFQGYNACIFAYGQTGMYSSWNFAILKFSYWFCDDLGLLNQVFKKRGGLEMMRQLIVWTE